MCANGADPCDAPPCYDDTDCADGETCGADRLCWGDDTSLTEADDGRVVTLFLGESLYVTLASNASTGYEWVVSTEPSPVLEQVGDSIYTSSSSGMPGEGGSQTFQFDAVAIGDASLGLEYLRTFESVPAIQSFNVTVQVR